MTKSLLLSLVASALAAFSGPAHAADLPEACSSYQAAVTAGPLPPSDSDIVIIRWLGNANFEFGYRNKVYLFDAYFDRTPRSHPLGFKAAEVSKAEAIFISHAHFDHISDVGPVARQTGAPVIGAPLTAEIAQKLGHSSSYSNQSSSCPHIMMLRHLLGSISVWSRFSPRFVQRCRTRPS